MVRSSRHKGIDCECIKYAPKLRIFDIRSNGINLHCRNCNRYVDPKKWKGGVVIFTNRSRIVPANECPCCGQRMSMHRRAKKKLENSLRHQLEHPELYTRGSQKKLKQKIALVESNFLRVS